MVELLGGAGGPELAGLTAELIEARDAALRSEIGALRREVAGLRGLLEGRAAAGPPPPSPPPIRCPPAWRITWAICSP